MVLVLRRGADIHQSIPYDDLLTALEIPSVRDLEDLVIDVIYAGLLGGKLHHHEKVLHVDWAAGRDVAPEDLEKIAMGLSDWSVLAQLSFQTQPDVALDGDQLEVRNQSLLQLGQKLISQVQNLRDAHQSSRQGDRESSSQEP
jgi:hypothetical protein